MEQRSEFARAGIDPGEIGSLVAVTSMARPREVVEVRLTTMLAGDDMLQMERLERRQPIWEVAVFAAPSSALTNLLAQRFGHLIRARTAAGARPLGVVWQ